MKRKEMVYCLDCGETVGEHKPNWGVEHYEKHPTVKGFLIK